MPGCSCARPLRCRSTSSPAGFTRGAAVVLDVRDRRSPRGSQLSVAVRRRHRSSERSWRRRRRSPSVFWIGHGTVCIRPGRRSSCWSPPPRFAPRLSMSTKRMPASGCRTAGWETTCRDRRGRSATIRWTMSRTASVDLHRGLVVSCNAYFAQLALHIGPQPLLDAASLFQIDVSQPPTAAGAASLPRASRLRTGSGGGVAGENGASRGGDRQTGARAATVRWTTGGASPAAEPQLLSTRMRRCLARYMREVVTSGTGRSLAANVTPIAGKTGTAEVDSGRAHSWFAGFAPYGVGADAHRIAFAVMSKTPAMVLVPRPRWPEIW